MFVAYSTDTAYTVADTVEKFFGLKSNATSLKGDDSDLNDDVVDGYSIYSNVCGSSTSDGSANGNSCTVISATTPTANGNGLAYNSMTDAGKVYDIFFFNEVATNMNQSSFFLNNNPGEQNKENGYYWELSSSQSSIAKFFSIFENVYDFSLRKGSESYREDSDTVCDTASDNFCYFKISDEKYINYYQVNFENRYILNATEGGYYYISPTSNYENHYETISNDYKGVYLKQEYRQEYSKYDANGKKYGESGFNSSSYYKGGYYYLYNSTTHRFDKFSINQNNYMWLNISNNGSISNGYNGSHYFKNSSGELYVLINDQDEQTLRRYYEYDESVSETYLSATLGDVAYYSSLVNPNDTALSNEYYFQTGNFKWYNYFTLEQPIFKGEAWISEDYYTSDPNSNSSLTENGNYSFTYLASKYQNQYVRDYAKLMNTTWFWNNTDIGYSGGYYYQLTGQKEEYSIWNRFLNTVKVVLPSTGTNDYYYYKDAVSSDQICNASSAYVGYKCYTYDLSSKFKLFIQYGVSDLLNKWTSLSTTSWTDTKPSTSTQASSYDTNATNTNGSGEKVGSVYLDSNGNYRINQSAGHKYSFNYTEYSWSNKTSGTYTPLATNYNHTGTVTSPGDYKTATERYTGGYIQYQNKGTQYNLGTSKTIGSTGYYDYSTSPTFTKLGGNYYLASSSKADNDQFVYSSNNLSTASKTLEYYYTKATQDTTLTLTYKVFKYEKGLSTSTGQLFGSSVTNASNASNQLESGGWISNYANGNSNCGGDVGAWTGYCQAGVISVASYKDITITLDLSDYNISTFSFTNSTISNAIISAIKSKLGTLSTGSTFQSTESTAYSEIVSEANDLYNGESSKESMKGKIIETTYFIYGVSYPSTITYSTTKSNSSSSWYSSTQSNSTKSVNISNLYRYTFNYTKQRPTTKSAYNATGTSNKVEIGTVYTLNTTTVYDFVRGENVTTSKRYKVSLGTSSAYAKPITSTSSYTSSWTTTYKSNGDYTSSTSSFILYNGTNNYRSAYSYKETWTGVSKSGYVIYDPNGKYWSNYSGTKSYKSDSSSYIYTVSNGAINSLFSTSASVTSFDNFKSVFDASGYYNTSENSSSKKITNITFTDTSITAYRKEYVSLYRSIDKTNKTYYFANADMNYAQKNTDLINSTQLAPNEGSLFTPYQGSAIDSDSVYKVNGYNATYSDGYDSNKHRIQSGSNGYIYTYTLKQVTKDNVTSSVTKTDQVYSTSSSSVSNGINGTANGSVNETKVPSSYTNEAQCVIASGGNNCTYYTYQKTSSVKYKYQYNVYKRTTDNNTIYKNDQTIFIAGKTKDDKGYSYGSDSNYQSKTKKDITTTDTSSYALTLCNSDQSKRGLSDCYILKSTSKISDYYAKIRISGKVLDHYETVTNDFVTTISQNTNDINYGINGAYPLCKDDYLNHPSDPSLNVPCYKYNESMRKQELEWIKYTYGEKSRVVGTGRIFLNTYNSNGAYVDAVSSAVDTTNLFNLEGFIRNKKFLLNSNGEIIFDTSSTYENVITGTSGNYSLTVWGSNLNGSVIYINGSAHTLNSNAMQTITFSSNGNLSIKINGSNFKGTLERVMLNKGNYSYYIPYNYNTSANKLTLKKTSRVNYVENKFYLAPIYESWQYTESGDTIYNDEYFTNAFGSDVQIKNFDTQIIAKNSLYNKSIFVFDGKKSEYLDGDNSRTRYKLFTNTKYNNSVVLYYTNQYDRKVFFNEGSDTNVLSSSYYTNSSLKKTVNVNDIAKYNQDAQKLSFYDQNNGGYIYYTDIVTNFSGEYGTLDNEYYSFIAIDGKLYFKKENKNTFLYDYGEFDIVHTYPTELTFNTESDAKNYMNTLFKGTAYNANSEGNNYTNLGIGTIDQQGNFSDLAKNNNESKYRIVKNNDGKYIIQVIYAVDKDKLTFSDKAKEEFYKSNSTSGTYTYNGVANNYNSSKDFYHLVNSNHSELTFEEGLEANYTNFKDATFYLFDKYKMQGQWIQISSSSVGSNSLYDSFYNGWTLGVSKEDSDAQKALALLNNTFILNMYGNNNALGYYTNWKNIASQDNILGFGMKNSNENNLNLISFSGDVQFYYAFKSQDLNIVSSPTFTDNTSYANKNIVKYGFGNSFAEALGYSDTELTDLGYEIGSMTLSKVYSALSSSGANSNKISIEVYQYPEEGGNAQKGTLNLYLPIYFRDTNVRLSRYYLQQVGGEYIVSGVQSYSSLTNVIVTKVVSLLNMGTDRDSFLDFSGLANIQTFGNKILTFEGSGEKGDKNDFGVSESWLLSEVLKKEIGTNDDIPEFILKNEGLGDVDYAGATFRSSTGESSLNNGSCFLWWCWNDVDDVSIDKNEEYRAKVWQYNALSDYELKEEKGFSYSVYALKEFYEIENPNTKYNYYTEIKKIASSKLNSINAELRQYKVQGEDYISQPVFDNTNQTLVTGGYESRGNTYSALRTLANSTLRNGSGKDLIELLNTNYITLKPVVSNGILQLELTDSRYLPTINSYFDDINQGIRFETFGTLSYILNNSVDESGNTNLVLNIFQNINDIGTSVTQDFSSQSVPELYFLVKDGMMYVYQKIINANFINGPQTFTPYVFNLTTNTVYSNNVSSLLYNAKKEDEKGNLGDADINPTSIITLDTLIAQGGSLCNGGDDGMCTLNLMWQTSLYDYLPIVNNYGYIPSNYYYGVDDLVTDPYMTKVISNAGNQYYTYDFFPVIPEGQTTIEEYSHNFVTNVNGMQVLQLPYYDDNLDDMFLLQQDSCSIMGGCSNGNAEVFYKPGYSKPSLATQLGWETVGHWLLQLFGSDIIGMIFGDYRGSFYLYTFQDLKDKYGVQPTLFAIYVEDRNSSIFSKLKYNLRPMIFVCATDNPEDCFGVKDGAELSEKTGAYYVEDIVTKDMFLGYITGSDKNFANLGTLFQQLDYSFIDWQKIFRENDRLYLSPSMVKNQEHPWYCFGADCSDSDLEASIDEFMNAGIIGFYYSLLYYSSNFSLFGAQSTEEQFMKDIFDDNNPDRFGVSIEGTGWVINLFMNYLNKEVSYTSVATGGGYYHYATVLPYVYNDNYVSTMEVGQEEYDFIMGQTSTNSTLLTDWISRLVQKGSFFDVSRIVDIDDALGSVGTTKDTDGQVNTTTYSFSISPTHTFVNAELNGSDVSDKYSNLIMNTMIGYDYSIFTYVPSETSPYSKNSLLNQATETKYINSCPVGFDYEKDGKCYFVGNYKGEITNLYGQLSIDRYDYLVKSSATINGNKESLMYATMNRSDQFLMGGYDTYIFGNKKLEDTITSLPADMDIYFVIRPRYNNGIVGQEQVVKIHTGKDYVNNPYGSRFENALKGAINTDSPYYFTDEEVRKNLIVNAQKGYYDDKGNLIKRYDVSGAYYVDPIYLDPTGKLKVSVQADSSQVKYIIIDPVTNKMKEGTKIVSLKAGEYEITTTDDKAEEIVFFAMNSTLQNNAQDLVVYGYRKSDNKLDYDSDWRKSLVSRDFLNDFYTYSSTYKDEHTELALGYAPSDNYLGRSTSETTIPDRLRLQYNVETMGVTKIYFDIFNKDNLNSQSTSIIPGSNVSSSIVIALENGYGSNTETYLTSQYDLNYDFNVVSLKSFVFDVRGDSTGTIGNKVNEFNKDFYADNNINQLKKEYLACHVIGGGNCEVNGYPDYDLADSLFFNNDATSKYGGYNLRIDELDKSKGTYSETFDKYMEALKGKKYKIVYRYEYTPGGESVFINIDQNYFGKNKANYITWKKSYDNSSDYSLFETVVLNGGARPIASWTGSGLTDTYNANGEAIGYEPIVNITGSSSFVQESWSVSKNDYIIVKYIDTWYLARLNENGTYGIIIDRKN